LSEKSLLTVIFWPAAGTLMCWYMVEGLHGGQVGENAGLTRLVRRANRTDCRLKIWLKCG
jgi:hypothetical protein